MGGFGRWEWFAAWVIGLGIVLGVALMVTAVNGCGAAEAVRLDSYGGELRSTDEDPAPEHITADAAFAVGGWAFSSTVEVELGDDIQTIRLCLLASGLELCAELHCDVDGCTPALGGP